MFKLNSISGKALRDIDRADTLQAETNSLDITNAPSWWALKR